MVLCFREVKMNGEERRQAILNELKNAPAPISASKFAKAYSVTRQIIVADIALLRAQGNVIKAEHYGYVLPKSENDSLLKRIVVKHTREEVQKELYVIVDNGATALDIVVDHPVYNKISADLNLSSRYDVDEFVKKLEGNGATPLSALTKGIHIHTIAVKNLDSYKRIVKTLSDLKILVEAE